MPAPNRSVVETDFLDAIGRQRAEDTGVDVFILFSQRDAVIAIAEHHRNAATVTLECDIGRVKSLPKNQHVRRRIDREKAAAEEARIGIDKRVMPIARVEYVSVSSAKAGHHVVTRTALEMIGKHVTEKLIVATPSSGCEQRYILPR